MTALAGARVLAVGAPDGPLAALADALRSHADTVELAGAIGVLDRDSWDLVILDAGAPQAAYYREPWPWTLMEAPEVFVPALVLYEPSDAGWVQGEVYARRGRSTASLTQIAARLVAETHPARLCRMEPRVPAALDPLFAYSAQELRKLTTAGAAIVTALGKPQVAGRAAADGEARAALDDGLDALREVLEGIEHLARAQLSHARRSRQPVVSFELAEALELTLARLGEADAELSLPAELPPVRGNAGVFAIALASVLAGHGRRPARRAPGIADDGAAWASRPPLRVAVTRSDDGCEATLRLELPEARPGRAAPVRTDDEERPIPVVSAWSWELLLQSAGARLFPIEWRDEDEPSGPGVFALGLRLHRPEGAR